MKKIAIITDSAANLSLEFAKRNKNLFIVPLTIIVDGVNYRDQVEITAEECYSKIDTNDISTSLPSMEDIESVLVDIKKQAYTDVIVINISAGLSGTFNAFRLALQDIEGLNVTQYDSKTLAAGLAYLVKHTVDAVKAKTPVDQIIKDLDQLRYKDSIALYTINTLKYLKKGGRIGKVEGTIGNMLRVKPVISVSDEGVYETITKKIGIQKSLLVMKEMLIEKYGDELIELTVHYGDDKPKAEELGLMLKKELNIKKLEIAQLTPVLGVHTGPRMFAYVARRVT